MNVKAIKLIILLTVVCTLFACVGTVCSSASARPGRVKSFKVKVSGRNVKLSWTKASGKVTRYVIYRNGKKIALVSRKTLKYTDKNRKYGKTYRYKVRAYRKDARLYGRWSVARKAVIRPGKVSGLNYTDNSSDQISLGWKKTSGAAGYAVYRDGKLAARTKNTSYTDKGLISDSKHEYYIKSYVKNGKKYVYGEKSKALKVIMGQSQSGRSLVDIYCAQSAKDAFSNDDLEYCIDIIIHRLEPQAVEMLLGMFPASREAAEQGQIGTQLGLYLFYGKGDKDGVPEHENVEPSRVQTIGTVGNVDGERKFQYLLAVDLSLLSSEGRYPDNGFMVMARDGEKMEFLEDCLTGEMLRAIMFDYNRTGMIGANNPNDAYRMEPGQFLDISQKEKYEKTVFPKWFTEGIVASVESTYRYENEQFKLLRGNENKDLLNNYIKSENGFDLENNVLTYDSEASCSVSGYLAVLYLADLMYVWNSNDSSINENGTVAADKLRMGLDDILKLIHQGLTLDEIIEAISPVSEGSDGNKLYHDTEEFEKYFIKGKKDGTGQYTGDKQSIDFVNALLDYLEIIDNGLPAGELPRGSILMDFDHRGSLLDVSKESGTDFLNIIESSIPVVSTAPDDAAFFSGGRSKVAD